MVDKGDEEGMGDKGDTKGDDMRGEECLATLEAAAELIGERCSLLNSVVFTEGVKLSAKMERSLTEENVTELAKLGMNLVGFAQAKSVVYPVFGNNKEQVYNYLKEEGIEFQIVPTMVGRAWAPDEVGKAQPEAKAEVEKAPATGIEHILLISTKIETCDACTTVTEFIKGAIDDRKVRVIDISDGEAAEIIEKVFSNEDFEYPAYIIKRGDTYKKGDLQELMFEMSE